MKSIVKLVFLAALGISCVAMASGETITMDNASFESPVVPLSPLGWVQSVAPTGWTAVEFTGSTVTGSGCGQARTGCVGYIPPPAVDGSQMAMLKGAGGMYQSIGGFNVGQTYTLSFFACGRVGSGYVGERANTIQALVGDTLATASALSFMVSGSSTTSLKPDAAYTNPTTQEVVGTWTLYTTTFTATNSTQVLEFYSSVNADKTTFIDNVSIAAVPEPSATVLSLSTSVGLLAYAWRKRTASRK